MKFISWFYLCNYSKMFDYFLHIRPCMLCENHFVSIHKVRNGQFSAEHEYPPKFYKKLVQKVKNPTNFRILPKCSSLHFISLARGLLKNVSLSPWRHYQISIVSHIFPDFEIDWKFVKFRKVIGEKWLLGINILIRVLASLVPGKNI